MYMQIIQGKVADAELMERASERWQAELRPGATGYLGMTGGITSDGRAIHMARFESQAAAEANSSRPEQDAWWNEMAKAYDGEPTFVNSTDVDLLLGGGSDSAGFVQVIQGRLKDESEFRAVTAEMESSLREKRPDILGIVVAWHGDGGGFTQTVYFKSEADARAGEAAMENDELRQRFIASFAEPPVFYDLTSPTFG